MHRELKCPSCKSEAVIQRPIISKFQFLIWTLSEIALIRRRCINCNYWAHVMFNGKSPEHIKKSFSEFEKKKVVSFKVSEKFEPNAISSEALEILFAAKKGAC